MKQRQVHQEQCAFPSHFGPDDGSYAHHAHGMSYLQFAAVMALQGVLASPDNGSILPKTAAERAVDCAASLVDVLEARGWLHRSR